MSPERAIVKHPNRALVTLLVLAAALGALAAYVLASSQNDNQATIADVCHATAAAQKSLRDVILISKAQGSRHVYPVTIRTDTGETAATLTFADLGKQTDAFYNQMLARVRVPKC